MSKIQIFLNLIFQFRRKLITYGAFQKYQTYKEELQNQKLNRDYIGVDKTGNKYYQYYSYFGLPTKREIDFKDRHNIHILDLAYFDWLTNRQPYAPTEYELEQFYLEVDKRKFLGQQWDLQQEQLMDNFYKQQQIQLEENQKRSKIQQQLLTSKNSQAAEVQSEIQSKNDFPDPNQDQQKDKDKDYQPDTWSPQNKKSRKQLQ